jgi:outer membrane protein
MKRVAMVLVSGLLSSAAGAYEKTDLVWRFAFSTFAPDVQSEALASSPDTVMDLNQDTRIGVGLSYMATDRFGVGLQSAWPFGHNLYAEDDTRRVRAGGTRLMPVTVTLQYFPPKLGRAQTWVGLGRNYIRFSNTSVGAGLSGDADTMRLSSSKGFAGEAGLDWDLDGNLSLSASVVYARAMTHMHLSQLGAPVDRVRIDLDPYIWNVGLARRF